MLRFLFSIFAFSILSAQAAQAAEIPHAWVGGQFGLAVPNADGTTARSMVGLTLGAKLGDNLGLGAYYQASHKDETARRFNYDIYGVQLSYHFDGDATGAWFGGRVGTSKVDTGSTYSPMNIGVVAGYDYLISGPLSLGGEVNWMSISDSGALAGFSTLDFLLALKLWF